MNCAFSPLQNPQKNNPCDFKKMLLNVLVILVVIFVYSTIVFLIASNDSFNPFSIFLAIVICFAITAIFMERLSFSNYERNNLVNVHQEPNKSECINEESPITLEPLQSPYLQIPPGHCYDRDDIDWILNNNSKILSNTVPTNAEKQCMSHFKRFSNINDTSCTTIDAHLH